MCSTIVSLDKGIWKNKDRNRRNNKQPRNEEIEEGKFEVKRRIRNIKKSDCHIHAKIEEKVKFIENNRKAHDVKTMCKVLGIAHLLDQNFKAEGLREKMVILHIFIQKKKDGHI